VNPPRRKDETVAHLKSMFQDAINTGGKTRYNAAKTRTGLKDNFLEFFTEHIFSVRSKHRGSSAAKETAVKDFVDNSIPKDPFSPVWRIKGNW
jgi:hypothetical protein